MALLMEAEPALHNGNAGLRSTICSHTDPVTLCGPAVTECGWATSASRLTGWHRDFELGVFEYKVIGPTPATTLPPSAELSTRQRRLAASR